jgi:hypothetical protein
MTLSSDIGVFLAGCSGGIIAEVLHWWNLRTAEKLPVYAYSPFYWGISFAMIIIGGFFCWIQFGSSADALVAVQVGLGAPIVLQKLITGAQASGARGSEASIRDFFRW